MSIETDDLCGDGFVLGSFNRVNTGYENCGLVFDDTFNVTRYSFRLATLVVSDDGGNGLRRAYLLSFRMSTSEVKVLFDSIENLQTGISVQQSGEGVVFLLC
ncbi:hypothetical protein Y032_0039g107 [Ancylostoma ceylanicum]|uniref:Uncharacterized protein n=1 Tax=Ancylostoma ceylanicum TaxID=53326 RepID=A0A016UJG4_9BILA|nr:hypothetical protein Y032_0039g107 [Ancylostoma ceylanicum]